MPGKRRCLLNCPIIKGATLFCFPSDEIRRLVWLRLIGMEHTCKIYTFLCGRHFSPRMFHAKRLRNDAVPDINLEYVELNESQLEEENKSQVEYLNYEGDEEEGQIESLDESFNTLESVSENNAKMIVLPKKFKIIPLKDAPTDPLFVPEREISPEIVGNPIESVDGSNTNNLQNGADIDNDESRDFETTERKSHCKASKTRKRMRKLRRETRSPHKSRTPLATLEMRIATRIWKSAEWNSENSKKLPTLHTQQKLPTMKNQQKQPTKTDTQIEKTNPISQTQRETQPNFLKISPKRIAVSPTLRTLAVEKVISPAGPMKVKNINDVERTWKEKIRKVEKETENAKVLIAGAQESIERSLHNSRSRKESPSVIIEETIVIEDDNDFSNLDIVSHDSSSNVVMPEESQFVFNSENSNSLSRKRTLKDLLCDEVLPDDDDVEDNFLPKPAKIQRFSKACKIADIKIDIGNIDDMQFDETMTPKARSSSNILMMGVEDFNKHAEDPDESESVISISEASQTGTKGKYGCGLIERYSYNGTFTMNCFHCKTEYPIWDWQRFIEHVTTEHKFEIKSRYHNNVISRDENVKVFKRQSLRSYPHFNAAELDRLLPNSNIQFVLVQGSEPNTVALMPLQDLLNENLKSVEIINSSKSLDNDDNTNDILYEDNFDDQESKSSIENDEDFSTFTQNDGAINIKKTDPARVTKFLNLLREHPLLWHSRRHGPNVYDEEAEKLIAKFDRTMTSVNFRRSMDYLRTTYSQFSPPTLASKEKLEKNLQKSKYIKMIKEIEDLSKNYAFYCDQCPYYFLDKDRLETHQYLKHNIGDLPYACSCGLRFPDSTKKDEHEQSHKPKPAFMCELCGMSFLFNRSLLNHMNSKHSEAVENPLPYKCSECDERFPNSQSRSWHALKHAPPRFNCHICGQTYLKSFPYKQHMKKHSGQRDYICEDCGKAFFEKRSLISHRFRVHKAGGYHCTYCNRYFGTYEKIFIHNQLRHANGANTDPPLKRSNKLVRDHTNRSYCNLKKRVFKCKQCDAVFERQYQLMRHKRLLGHNAGERYLKCSQCSVVCKSRMALVRHLRKLHELPLSFGNVREEDYIVPTYDVKNYDETIEVNDEEEDYAIHTITCTEEEEENRIVTNDGIEEIFEEYEDDFIEEIITDHVS